jgi:hypothetical protein
MSKQALLLTVAISLSAGTAQADATNAQDSQPRPAMTQSTTPEPTRNPGATKPAQRMAAGHERHPAEGPVNPDNPDCGQYGGE